MPIENEELTADLTEEDKAFAEFANALDADEEVGDSAPLDEDEQSDDEDADESDDSTDESADEADEQQSDDIWGGLSDAQREALEAMQRQASQLESEKARLMHDVQSNRGRVSALSKKLEQIQQQQNESQSEGRQQPSGEDGDFNFDEFAEDFPEMATAMRSFMTQTLASERKQLEQEFSSRFQQYDTVIQPLQERHRQEFLDSQIGEVAKVHPDFEQVTAGQDFWSWVDQQHDSVKALSDSDSAQDNILLLNLYKSQNVVQQQSAPAPQTRNPQRNRQLADMESLPRKGASRSAGVPDDEEAAFDHFARQIDNGKY